MSATTTAPRFAVALVNYKTEALTRICLALLRKALAHYDAEVWVVDNDSADGSTHYLRSLDWIHLIERKHEDQEEGFQAHGRALNLIMERTSCDYVFLMHTDTLIHDALIFGSLLQKCLADPSIFLVGCLDQIDRGRLRSAWRLTTRGLSHYTRRLKLAIGLKSKAPNPYRETHVKSFFALWNYRILRDKNLQFLMNDQIPGYEAQDLLLASGYQRRLLSPRKIFRYLDHVEAGTISAIGGYQDGHRRLRKYNALIERYTPVVDQ